MVPISLPPSLFLASSGTTTDVVGNLFHRFLSLSSAAELYHRPPPRFHCPPNPLHLISPRDVALFFRSLIDALSNRRLEFKSYPLIKEILYLLILGSQKFLSDDLMATADGARKVEDSL